jgi:hypothetical protein
MRLTWPTRRGFLHLFRRQFAGLAMPRHVFRGAQMVHRLRFDLAYHRAAAPELAVATEIGVPADDGFAAVASPGQEDSHGSSPGLANNDAIINKLVSRVVIFRKSSTCMGCPTLDEHARRRAQGGAEDERDARDAASQNQASPSSPGRTNNATLAGHEFWIGNGYTVEKSRRSS